MFKGGAGNGFLWLTDACQM